MNQGVVYVAIGRQYVDEAALSAKSVKAADPGIAVALVTDQAVEPGGSFDLIIRAPESTPPPGVKYAARDRAPYYHKIDMMAQSPFERTIYLDTDTHVTRSLKGVLGLLEQYEMLITHGSNAEADYGFERTEPPFSSVPREFGDINTGMVAFRRCEKVAAFFRDWSHNYREHTCRFTTADQPAFKLTLFQSQIRYHTLSTLYNWISWIPNFIPQGGRIVVLHGRNPWLRKWVGEYEAVNPTVVGPVSLRNRIIYYGTRALYWLQRKGIIKAPKE